MKRLFLIFLVLATMVIVPFLIWGSQVEESMSLENTASWLRSTGNWAWAAGIGLLIIDLFLPILGTVVMSALGLVYGWFIGGLLSALGSIAAGLLAYGLAYKLGRKAVLWLTGENGLAEGERLFHGETGGWLVAFSRWMPVLPEVVACLAGITKMPFKRFLAALCAGCFPMGFIFAWIGETGNDHPVFALILSAGLPPLIWGAFRLFYRKEK
ncbi:MAG: VTT domain-containing protein [Akkermansiaceae bacterium]|nr:VTT domain-containing protein [Akkermansiaceae bacterium]